MALTDPVSQSVSDYQVDKYLRARASVPVRCRGVPISRRAQACDPSQPIPWPHQLHLHPGQPLIPPSQHARSSVGCFVHQRLIHDTDVVMIHEYSYD